MHSRTPDLRRTAVKGPDYFGMNRYEWALAKARMDRAMILADLALRSSARVRTIVRGILDALGRGLSQKRPRTVRAS